MGLVPSSSQGGGGGGGTVTSVTAGDTSIVAGGTAAAVTLETGTLDEIATLHPPAAAVAMNGKKITGGAAGTAGTDFAIVEQLPGTEIGYDQITAPVAITATSESAGTAIIACAAHTFDGGEVMVEFFSPSITMPQAASANNFINVSIFEGATELGRLCEFNLTGPASAVPIFVLPAIGKFRFEPSAGSHTYTITAYVNSTTGTPVISAGAGGTATKLPAYCRFTKV